MVRDKNLFPRAPDFIGPDQSTQHADILSAGYETEPGLWGPNA
jgi:hypothetical protein